MTFVRKSATVALMLNVVFTISAFILLAFRGETIDLGALTMGGTIVLIMLIFYNATNKIFKYPDRIVTVCCIVPCLYRPYHAVSDRSGDRMEAAYLVCVRYRCNVCGDNVF